MGWNLDPRGGGPLDGYSVTGCAFFLDLGSEMTWLTSSTGTMYQGLRFLTLFAMVLKEVDFWSFSAMVLKEVSFLDPSSMVLKEPFFLHILRIDGLERTRFGSIFGTFSGWSWKDTFTWFLVNGLERILIWALFTIFSMEVIWTVLKGLHNDSDLLLCDFHGVLPSMFNRWSWKGFLELFSVFLIAKTDLEIFLHNTHMRPNLMLAGCPMMIGFGVLVSTT